MSAIASVSNSQPSTQNASVILPHNISPKNTGFSEELIQAIGEENFAKMPEVNVVDISREGNFENMFSLDMFQESPAIKGIDHMGHRYVAFTVVNPRYETVNQERESRGFNEYCMAKKAAIVVVSETTPNNGDFFLNKSYSIPTNDTRIMGLGKELENYHEAVGEIFAGKHRDLSLGATVGAALEYKIHSRENALNNAGVSKERIAYYLALYNTELILELSTTNKKLEN